MIFLRQYFVTEPQHRANSGSDLCNKNAHNAREKYMHTQTESHTQAQIVSFYFILL